MRVGVGHVVFFQTLDELTDNCRTQSTELVKTVSQYSQTKEEVRQIRCASVCSCVCVWEFPASFLMLLIGFNRAIVSELKEEVRCSARGHGPASRQTFPSSSYQGLAEHLNHACTLDLGASLLPQRHGGEVRVKEAMSDSEDSSLTPSLAEVSSDDLSWLDDRDPGEGDRSLLSAPEPQLISITCPTSQPLDPPSCSPTRGFKHGRQ